MKNTLINLAIFAAGAAIGSAVTWKILKDRYEQLAIEEEKSIREYYCGKDENVSEEYFEEDTAQPEAVDIKKYNSELANLNYVKYSDVEKKECEVEDVEKPYIIPPDEFDSLDGYEIVELIYFADGVLTDDDYEIVDDFEEIIGADSLKRFGEYEPDSVHVRNDKLKCDYEITLDLRNYSDVKKVLPR